MLETRVEKVRSLRRVGPRSSAGGASFAGMSWLALARTALVVAIAVSLSVTVVLEVRRYRTLIRRRIVVPRRRWR